MANLTAAVIACVSCAGLLAGTVRAQCDYDLTSYPSSELEGIGAVSALTVFDDGSGPALVAGGTELLPIPGEPSGYTYNIAKWSPMAGWVPLGDELHSVRDLCAFNGQLYAAASPARVARWDGAQWVSVKAGLNQWVSELAVFDDALGGGPALFALTSTWPCTLLKLTNGGWREIARFNHWANALHVFGGELIVAGYFTSIEEAGVMANRIAAWNGDRWATLGEGLDGGVLDLIEYDVNSSPVLVAGGSFVLSGEKDATDVAYWDGTNWFALPEPKIAEKIGVSTLGVWDNGSGAALYAAVTSESDYSGDQRDTLCRLDERAQRWQAIASTYYLPNSGIRCMAPYHEGASKFPTLFVGGKFSTLGGVQSANLARVLPQLDGSVEPLPSDPKSLHRSITSLAQVDDGSGPAVYAGGSFPRLPGWPRVARFNGEAWTGVGYGGLVETLKVMDDGSGPALYAGGAFGTLTPHTGSPPARLAKWDGSAWASVGAVPFTVRAMCVHDDGAGLAIYVLNEDGDLARWNATTGTWSVISADVGGAGCQVNTIISFDDGSGSALYMGGRFDAVNAVPAMNIARWRGPIKGWTAVGAGLPAEVAVLHVYDDGSGPKLIANGLVQYSPSPAQWDGNSWSPVGDIRSISFPSPDIKAMTTFDDGSGPALIVSNGVRTARWNGSFWAHLPKEGADAFVADGDVLYMGGPFSTWAPGGSALSISSQSDGGSFNPASSMTLHVNVVHGGAVTYQWRHNGSPLINVGGFSGVHSERLRIYAVHGGHEGVFDVVVSNDCTNVVSEPIVVDVNGTCPGDLTFDNVVEVNDLLALIGSWGSCPQFPPCLADLTHDRVVDAADLATLISRWGPCP